MFMFAHLTSQMSNKLELKGQRWLSKLHASSAHVFTACAARRCPHRTPIPEKRSGEQGKGGEGECLSSQFQRTHLMFQNVSHFLNLANSKIEDLPWQCQILCICFQIYQSLKMRFKKKKLQINDYRKGNTLILFLRQQLIYFEQYSAVL